MIGGLDGNRMLIGLLIGIVVLIFLVLKTKVQAFLALIICTVIVGVVGGMPLSNTTLDDGTIQIIEVKGDNMIDDDVVRAKAEAAREMASASKMEYLMLAGSKIMQEKVI